MKYIMKPIPDEDKKIYALKSIKSNFYKDF
jgi:hypothetical protein